MAEIYKDEDKIEKLNLGVWKDAFRYLLPHWPLIILIVLCMIGTSFFDSSFTPAVNFALTNSSKNIAITNNIFDVILNFNILGFKYYLFYNNNFIYILNRF